MDGFFAKLFEHFSNSKRSIGKKLGDFTMIIILLVFLDLMFNFTYGLHQSKSIERLQNIQKLRIEYSQSKKVSEYLDEMEENIISNKHPYDVVLSFISSLSLPRNKAQIKTDETKTNPNKLSIVFIALSSSTLFIFFVFGAITSPFWSGNFSFKNIKESVAVALVSSLIVVAITSLLSLIPVIVDSWVNYSLYFLVQIILLWISWKIFDKYDQRKKKEAV